MADEPIDFEFEVPPGVEPPANPVKLKGPLRYQWSARVLLRIARGGDPGEALSPQPERQERGEEE